jgi:hypothetical protein
VRERTSALATAAATPSWISRLMATRRSMRVSSLL